MPKKQHKEAYTTYSSPVHTTSVECERPLGRRFLICVCMTPADARLTTVQSCFSDQVLRGRRNVRLADWERKRPRCGVSSTYSEPFSLLNHPSCSEDNILMQNKMHRLIEYYNKKGTMFYQSSCEVNFIQFTTKYRKYLKT